MPFIKRLPQFEPLEQMRERLKDELPPIKPCPFCGNPHTDLEGYNEITVVCHKCKAEGPPVRSAEPYDAIRIAVAKWNERS